jgi:hypothetical protein
MQDMLNQMQQKLRSASTDKPIDPADLLAEFKRDSVIDL